MFHPDRFNHNTQSTEWRLANEMLKELNQAYNVLRDPKARSAYDSTLRNTTQQSSRFHTAIAATTKLINELMVVLQ